MWWWVVLGSLGLAYSLVFIYKTKTGSPYLPSETKAIEKIKTWLPQGVKVCDFGAGDGKLMKALARDEKVKEVWGWEIEPLVWLKGWWQMRQLSQQERKKIHYHWGDMWQVDLGQFEVVVVYQLERFNTRLAQKCKQEMRPGSLVIANTYPVRGLSLKEKDGQIYVYQI